MGPIKRLQNPKSPMLPSITQGSLIRFKVYLGISLKSVYSLMKPYCASWRSWYLRQQQSGWWLPAKGGPQILDCLSNKALKRSCCTEEQATLILLILMWGSLAEQRAPVQDNSTGLGLEALQKIKFRRLYISGVRALYKGFEKTIICKSYIRGLGPIQKCSKTELKKTICKPAPE